MSSNPCDTGRCNPEKCTDKECEYGLQDTSEKEIPKGKEEGEENVQ